MQPTEPTFTPEEAVAHWPGGRPLAALVTGSADARWGRWSVLAEPSRAVAARTHADALRAIEEASSDGGTWIVALAYELGAAFEPRALPHGRMPDDGWPLALLVRCGGAIVHDHAAGRWRAEGTGGAALLAEVTDRAARGEHDGATARIESLEADVPRAEFERMVAQAVEFVRAGDVFQANVAQRFTARWDGSPRAVLRAALRAARPRYGAYLEHGAHALVGMSPELYVDMDRAAGTATSRPIKGTRAFHEDPAELVASGKDAAELHMIVDLMRNDLGRVAVPGGVEVRVPREVESHETVHHCVAEVHARLRPGTSPLELLRASFPPGSVTGAPKVRAMQVIDALEPCARGMYCGAAGILSPARMELNVAIRTIMLARGEGGAPGTLRYSAGCGIVAESDPRGEYEESIHKAAVLVRTAHALSGAGAPRAYGSSAPPAPRPSAGGRG
jgi:anthranilate/para-aminobenzoate synthase component I